MRLNRLAIGVGTSFLAAPAAAQVNPSQVQPTEIVVLAATPLSDFAEDVLAFPAQTATDEEIEASHAGSVTEYLRRLTGGVFVNDVQNNPLQPDINYRGFTASPLLGTAQGLSLYMDGVRLNQPFGEVVSWDLIPKSAIRSLSLVPGSNPLFGRNSLGGALSVLTKDGRSDPGFEVEGSHGSFGREVVEAQGGGSGGGFDWFVSGDGFKERGWRDHSSSQAVQVFGKLRWTTAATRVALTGSFADTDLNGNGLQEMRLLKADRSSVYTHPDNTRNRSGLLNLILRHDLSDRVTMSGNLFRRAIRAATFNGDVNDDALGEDVYQPDADERAALAAAGYTGFPEGGETQANTPFPRWRCIANVLLNRSPNQTCNGLANRSADHQREWGATGELSWRASFAGLGSTLTLGGAYVQSQAHFRQSSQFGYLDADRGIAPVNGAGAFADGTQETEEAFDSRVDLVAHTSSFSLYALDSVTTGGLQLNVSARYDKAVIHNRDAITPGGGTGSLDTDQRFARLNPALAMRYALSRSLAFDAAIAQTSRPPSAIELGCADPESPCRLPNAMAGDPPLKQVVARTLEGGLTVTWHTATIRVGAFRTVSRDDILFVAADAASFGYFRNFGKTRRQGVDLDLTARMGRLRLTGHYTYLDVTYRSSETVDGLANSSADHAAPGLEGEIGIEKGDRIPLIPRHVFKAGVTFEANDKISLNLDMIAASGALARGNENGAHQPDGVYYLGPGRTAAYTVFNAGLEYRPTKALTFFAQASNLFNTRYATAAQLGNTAFDAAGNFTPRPFASPLVAANTRVSSTFYAPGAPSSMAVGVRLRL